LTTERYLTVSDALCTGCSECIDACPVGAIQLQGSIAVIDPDKCTQCEICLRICPQGAIYSVLDPAKSKYPVPAPQQEPEVIHVRVPEAAPVTSAPARQPSAILPALVGVVAYVGRELPRILPHVLDALERRASKPATGSNSVPSTQRPSDRPRGSGKGRRHRHRGG